MSVRLGKAHVLGEAEEDNALTAYIILPLLRFYYHVMTQGSHLPLRAVVRVEAHFTPRGQNRDGLSGVELLSGPLRAPGCTCRGSWSQTPWADGPHLGTGPICTHQCGSLCRENPLPPQIQPPDLQGEPGLVLSDFFQE